MKNLSFSGDQLTSFKKGKSSCKYRNIIVVELYFELLFCDFIKVFHPFEVSGLLLIELVKCCTFS